MTDDWYPPGLDLSRLRRYLERAHPGLVTGPLTGRLIEGGRSNLTYAVTDGHSRWVVRRPPLGHVLATAHDMAREHRVISALANTPVPVPRTVALCQDTSVLDAPFYLMEFVSGTPYRSAEQLAELGPRATGELVRELTDTLAALHAVDPHQVGLGDFGRPEGFLERQLGRWGKQLAASRSRELPGMPELREALARSVPTSTDVAVVHGDYRLDNVLAAPPSAGGGSRWIRAVLDWEMSTLGDPLTDLGLLVMYSGLPAAVGALVSTTGTAPGHPSPEDLVERYAAASGRDVTRIGWYTAFACFKLAVILEGIHYRHSLGQTVGAGFDRIGDLVPVLIDRGLTTVRKG